MKGIRQGLVAAVLPALTFLVAASALAEPKLTTVPDGLTVSGTRGFDEVRTVILKPSATTQNWKLTSVDLPRKDGVAIFPAALVQPDPTQGAQIPASDLVSIPVRFQLSHAPASGQFSGVLLVRYDGGDTTVPVTLTVKDPPWIPILLIVLGVVVGLALSTYQAEGLDRDEITVQIERLRVQMQANEKFNAAFSPENNPFLNQVNGLLVKVATALEGKKWEEARSLANSARAGWDKWQVNEAEWLRLLKYKQDELNSRFDQDQGLPSEIPYGKAVKHSLDDAVLQMPEYDSPKQFAEKLQTIGQQIDRYLQGQQQIDRLSLLRNRMDKLSGISDVKKTVWGEGLVALQTQLGYLLPTDDERFAAWMQEIDATLKEMNQAIEQAETTEGSERGLMIVTRDVGIINHQYERVLDSPFISSRKPGEKLERAETRLNWNRQALKWIAITSLAGVGFNQLYVSNSTFGANWFGDYFMLLAWGFGAEVSRESVTKVLQRFRLPGTQ
ncbi:hypothetical protein ACN4EK_13460 [Pantanalinema rosaneae CENA516]|uniref:hypothetical protein n=1 Tax=Pantanalinema rosaneae TaxID=1620701 RepID=UPI003D7006DB